MTQQIQLKDVASAYSGKKNKCCCGCSGKHYHAKNMGDYRGGGKPNDIKNIKRILEIVNSATSKEIDPDGVYVTVTVENRWYVIYLKKKVEGD